jgi:hypothetical protein
MPAIFPRPEKVPNLLIYAPIIPVSAAKLLACCGIVRAIKKTISSWGDKTPCQE